MATVIAIHSRKQSFRPMNPTPKFEVTCASCNLRELCLPGAVCLDDLERIESIVYARRRVKRGEALPRAWFIESMILLWLIVSNLGSGRGGGGGSTTSSGGSSSSGGGGRFGGGGASGSW